MQIYFLGASVALTKHFRADGTKDAYPLVANFTSYEEQVNTPSELLTVIKEHADKGHCLLKGKLSRPLTNESRRGTTTTNDTTQWVCLDFDRHEAEDIDEVLAGLGLGDTSYVLQYSASHGLDENEGTISAHVFMLLDREIAAPTLKAWLMGLNLTHLRDKLRLSRSQTVMSWPLDVTTCQNDKLLYIAAPTFETPLKDPLRTRISLVKREKDMLPVTRINETNINVLKVDERKRLNELRKAAGLKARNAQTTWVGGTEIQNKPDVAEVTGIKDGGEFVRLNINGGDSWAYWHSKANFELIHDFKSDTWYRTKDFLPSYYKELCDQRSQANATPTATGDLILAFCDKPTGRYYKGLWNPATQNLELYEARNETQVNHWMLSHGLFPGEYIPNWTILYDPRSDWIVDEERHLINRFVMSPYMRLEPSLKGKFPHIEAHIKHMLGCTNNKEDAELYNHFLNWFAAVFQREFKPLTSWVIHGTEGTGKGFFFTRIAEPLLDSSNAISVTVGNLEDQFNAWLEGKLFVLVDEVDVDDFREKGRVTSKLRTYITEQTISLRRMRQTSASAPNYASFLFASNRPQPVFIPEGDRRYNVGNFQHVKITKPDEEKVSAELEAFAQWLLAHKVDIQAANTVLHTAARERIQKLGISSMVETCNAMRTGDLESLWMSLPDEKLLDETRIENNHTAISRAYATLIRKIASEALENPVSALSRDEMLLIIQYNVSGSIQANPNKFTSLLRHNGIETKRLRRNGALTYGMDVTWQINDELRKELLQTLTPSKKIRRIS